ncbi:hypothetical protein P7F88_00565 [Vibrio hannami]|uniref:PilN domain-containing protein n=1 Tax=Vibrio hannami TaxID=2717094 RepID=UPI00240F7324|nr:PilN domain-containing protein [Vibrio hannami]MDG3084666.1 hypothetical protein [Vibrio hannami]
MPDINLLPWREKKRAQYRRVFWLLLGLVLLITVAVHLLILSTIEKQILTEATVEQELTLALNKMLQNEKQLELLTDTISELDKRIILLDRMSQNQSMPVSQLHLFVEHVPKTLLFTRVLIAEGTIEISGVAQQTESITMLSQRLESESKVTDINVHAVSKIKEGEHQGFHEFLLKFPLNEEASH